MRPALKPKPTLKLIALLKVERGRDGEMDLGHRCHRRPACHPGKAALVRVCAHTAARVGAGGGLPRGLPPGGAEVRAACAGHPGPPAWLQGGGRAGDRRVGASLLGVGLAGAAGRAGRAVRAIACAASAEDKRSLVSC